MDPILASRPKIIRWLLKHEFAELAAASTMIYLTNGSDASKWVGVALRFKVESLKSMSLHTMDCMLICAMSSDQEISRRDVCPDGIVLRCLRSVPGAGRETDPARAVRCPAPR